MKTFDSNGTVEKLIKESMYWMERYKKTGDYTDLDMCSFKITAAREAVIEILIEMRKVKT